MPPDTKTLLLLTICLVSVLAKPPPGYVKKPEQDEHPPRYEFGYEVHDEQGARQGHEEARDGEHAAGRYFVALPDGSTQTVSYTADDWGFHPLVSYSRSSQSSASSARIALGEEAVAALHGKQVGKKLKLPSSKVAVQPLSTVGARVVQPVVPVSPAVAIVTPATATQATPVAAVVLPANQQQEQVVAVTAGGSAASAYQQQNAVYQQQGGRGSYQQAGAGVSSAFQRQGAAITVPVAAQINALVQEGSTGASSVQVTGLQQQQYIVAPAAQQIQAVQQIRTQPASYQSVASGTGGSQQQAYNGILDAGLNSYSYQDAAVQDVSVKSSGASGYQSAATGGTTVLTTTPSPLLIQTTPSPYAATDASIVTTTGLPILSTQQVQHISGDALSTVIIPSQSPQYAQVIAGQAQGATGAQSVDYQAVNGYQATGGGIEYNSVNSLPKPQALIAPYDNRGGAQVSSYVADANAALSFGARKAVRLPNVGSTLSTAQATVSYNEGSNQVVEYNAVTPTSVRTSLRPIVVADFQESQQNIATVTPSPLGISYSSTPSNPIVVPDFSSSAAGSASSGSYSGYVEQESHVSTQRPIIVESSTSSGLYTASPTASSLDVVTITPRPEVLPVPSALASSSQKLSKYAVQGRLSSTQSRFGAKLRPFYSTTKAPPQVTEKVEEESSNVVISQSSVPAGYSYDQNQGYRLQTSLPVVVSTPAPVIYSEQSREEESNIQINVNQVDSGAQVQQDQQQLLLEAVNGLQYNIGKLQEQAALKTREEEELLQQEKLRAQHQVQLIKQALAETDAKLKEQSLKEAQLRAQIQAEKQAIQTQQSLSYSAGSAAQGQYQPVVNRIPRPEFVAETVVQSSYNTQAGGATVESFPPVKYIVQSSPEEQLQPIDAYQSGKVLQPNLKVTPLQPALVNPIGAGGLYLVYGGRVQPVGRLPALYSQQSYVDANLLKAQQQQQQQTSLNFLADLQKQVQAQYRQGLVVDAGTSLAAVKPQLSSGLVEARVRQHESGSSSIRQLLEGEKEHAGKHSAEDDRPRITIEQTKYLEVQRPLPPPQPTALPVPYALPQAIQVPLQQLLPVPQLTHLPYREYQTLIPNRPVASKAINFGLAELYHGHADFRGERYGVPRQRLRPAPSYYAPRGPAPSLQSGRRRPPSYQRGQLRKLCIEYGGFKPPIVPSQQIDDEDVLDVAASSAAAAAAASGAKE